MGITEDVWSEICTPKAVSSDLDSNTPLYIDCYVALRVLGMRYPEYIRITTPQERILYQLFLAMESAKEERAHKRAQQEAEDERLAQAAIDPRMAYR